MNKLKALVVVVFALFLVGAVSAYADTIDVHTYTGTYTFAGTNGSVLTATLTGIGTTLPIVVTTIPPGGVATLPDTAQLKIVTGAYNSSTMTFGSGGTFTLCSDASCTITYMSGTLTGGILDTTSGKVTIQYVTTTVNASLLADLGLSPTETNWVGSIAFTLGANGITGSSDTILSTPEPASLLLLGTGLLGLGGAIRRKLGR